MSNEGNKRGRLSTLVASLVIARRDFGAVLFSRSFFFFLLGPLFPVLVGGMAGGIGNSVREQTDRPQLGIAMEAAQVDSMMAARHALVGKVPDLPQFVEVARLKPGEAFNPVNAMIDKRGNLAAILSGSPAAPVLTGTVDRTRQWRGPVALVAAQALGEGPKSFPEVTQVPVATSRADEHHGRIVTAQMGQTLLFLLTMLLAGMVMSNLVEEKANKIIEILAAAVPMDAVFFGKLFAMLAVSLVGIAVWSAVGTATVLIGGKGVPFLGEPAVGWPMFVALGVIYFSMAYLLLGSLFLTIGAMATTVRDVQTLSMPVTMMQLLVFFFASYAMAKPGSGIELAAVIVPFSSPFAMIARAAQDGALWPHAAALGWQALCVTLFVRGGARLFRTQVMKSGPAQVGKRRFWRRAEKAAA